jgi:hypothetical protein
MIFTRVTVAILRSLLIRDISFVSLSRLLNFIFAFDDNLLQTSGLTLCFRRLFLNYRLNLLGFFNLNWLLWL